MNKPPLSLKTLTSLNKEVWLFFLGDNSIWRFPLLLPLAITAFGGANGYFCLAIRAFGAFGFICPKYLYRLGKNGKRSLDSLTLRLLNALNSEDRGLKVRFSLAMIVFETFELILCQMLSSQGENAPSNSYPHYLVRLATSRNLMRLRSSRFYWERKWLVFGGAEDDMLQTYMCFLCPSDTPRRQLYFHERHLYYICEVGLLLTLPKHRKEDKSDSKDFKWLGQTDPQPWQTHTPLITGVEVYPLN